MNTLSQTMILLCSCTSIWLLAGRHKRLGFMVGLMGQPFWLITSYSAGQWGVFITSLWFTMNHVRGIWNHR